MLPGRLAGVNNEQADRILLMAFIAFLQFVEDIISVVRKEHLDVEMSATTDV